MAKISTSACKAKGRRLQDSVREQLLKLHPSLEEDDIKCAIMGESGTDIKLSPAARKLIPFSIECKNQEKINIWGSISQCEANAKGTQIPLLIFKRNRTKTYACIEFDQLLQIITQTSKIPDNSGTGIEKSDSNT